MRFFLRFFVPFHNFVFRLTRGRALGQFELPVLLLTTTGRRSGKQRTIPLLYLEEDGTLLVVASMGGGPAIRAGTTTSSPTPRSRYRHAPAGAGCEPSPWSGRTGIAGSSGSRPQRTDTRRTSPALIGRYRSWRCGRSRPAQMVILEIQAEYEAPEVSRYAGPFRRRRLAHPVPIVRPVRSPVRFAQRHRGPRLVRPWTREPRCE